MEHSDFYVFHRADLQRAVKTLKASRATALLKEDKKWVYVCTSYSKVVARIGGLGLHILRGEQGWAFALYFEGEECASGEFGPDAELGIDDAGAGFEGSLSKLSRATRVAARDLKPTLQPQGVDSFLELLGLENFDQVPETLERGVHVESAEVVDPKLDADLVGLKPYRKRSKYPTMFWVYVREEQAKGYDQATAKERALPKAEAWDEKWLVKKPAKKKPRQ